MSLAENVDYSDSVDSPQLRTVFVLGDVTCFRDDLESFPPSSYVP